MHPEKLLYLRFSSPFHNFIPDIWDSKSLFPHLFSDPVCLIKHLMRQCQTGFCNSCTISWPVWNLKRHHNIYWISPPHHKVHYVLYKHFYPCLRNRMYIYCTAFVFTLGDLQVRFEAKKSLSHVLNCCYGTFIVSAWHVLNLHKGLPHEIRFV